MRARRRVCGSCAGSTSRGGGSTGSRRAPPERATTPGKLPVMLPVNSRAMRPAALDDSEELFNNPTMPARLQVLLAAVCFGTTGTAQAIGPSASPVAVGAARIVVGGALLVAIARALRLRMPPRGATVAGIAVGVCIYQLSFFAAVKLTGVAGGAGVAIGTGPAPPRVPRRPGHGERPTPRRGVATPP